MMSCEESPEEESKIKLWEERKIKWWPYFSVAPFSVLSTSSKAARLGDGAVPIWFI